MVQAKDQPGKTPSIIVSAHAVNLAGKREDGLCGNSRGLPCEESPTVVLGSHVKRKEFRCTKQTNRRRRVPGMRAGALTRHARARPTSIYMDAVARSNRTVSYASRSAINFFAVAWSSFPTRLGMCGSVGRTLSLTPSSKSKTDGGVPHKSLSPHSPPAARICSRWGAQPELTKTPAHTVVF